MLIKEIKLENYGRHKSLHLKDLGAPIIGIVGANGNGKSTILKAISFAFKGKEDDSAITDSISIGEDHGSIELYFEKQGTQGRILRKFGKHDSAVLEWDNEKYTRKTEINKKIDEILGVDKQVLSNTIFIKQGEMLELINATPAKRIELFSKLLNLDYFSKRFNCVNAVYKEGKESIKDLHALEDDIAKKTEELDALKKNTEDLESLLDSKYINQIFINDLAKSLDQYFLYNKLYNERLASLANYEPISTLNDQADKLRESISDNENKLTLNQAKNLTTGRDLINLSTDAKIIENVFKYTDTIFNWFGKSSDYDAFDINYANSLVKKSENRKVFAVCSRDWYLQQKSFLEMQKLIDCCVDECENLRENIDSTKSILFTLNNAIQSKKELLDLRTKLFSKLNKDDKCPICGLQIMLGQEISQDDLSRLREEIKSTCDVYETTKSRLKTLEDKFTKADAKLGMHRTDAMVMYNNMLNSFSSLLSIDSYDPLSSQEDIYLKEYQLSRENNLLAKHKLLDAYKDFVKPLKFLAMDLNSMKIRSLECISNELQEVKNEMTLINSEYDSLRSNIAILTKDLNNCDSKITIIEGITESCKELELKKSNLNIREKIDKLEEFTKEVFSIDNLHNTFIPKALSDYEDLRIKKGSINLLESALESSKNTLNQRKDQNAKQFDYLYKLNAIAEGLNIKNKDSLPKAYVNYLFKYIIEHVKESLALMETNFIIDIDNDEELAVKFKRISDLDKPWLKMQRLSGGEKVRLSIAFLIAIQKIICPTLGFLVLDEPSTHLDGNSVEALADMLTSVSNVLKTSKSQIWFVDHNPALERCCNKKITI